MLLKNSELDAIRCGQTSLVFRRWRKPSVRTGGSLKTAIGVLSILQFERIDRDDITAADAQAAGCPTLSELLDRLDEREGDVYRIQVRYAGDDPRIQLRASDRLTPADLSEIRNRLERLDAASRTGPWTQPVLLAIARHPHLRAASLSEITGFEKERLKTDVRKLKNLGLTISRHSGYELSPRGIVVLEHLQSEHRQNDGA